MHVLNKLLSYLIISLFFYNISFCQSVWEVRQSPTGKNLNKCFFTDTANGWIYGDSGIIIHTSDSGNDWLIQNTGTDNEIKSLFFINNRIGWATAWRYTSDSLSFPGTIILKTTNGGNNWISSEYPDTNTFLSSIYFLDSLKGFISATPKFILNTTNGGIAWNPSVSDTTLYSNLPINKIIFYNNEIGYACGGTRDFIGIVWTTTNSGLSWIKNSIGVDPVTDIFIFNQDSAICTGGDFKFGANYFTSSDQGKIWNTFALGYAGIATCVDFRTKNEGWISLGNSERFFFSSDGGVNWSAKNTPLKSAVNDIAFIDSLNGWAVGNNGVILKYNPTVTYNNNSTENIIPATINLYQNYPNPFNPFTKINYELPESPDVFNGNYVSLKVYDVSGNEISTLVDKKQNPGFYSLNFDASDFSSGVYFYALRVNDFFLAKKMVVLK